MDGRVELSETPRDSETILDRLRDAPYGAYGIDLNQCVVFWNAQAEEILGYSAEEVLGKKCYEAVQVLSLDGATAICTQNCPAIVAANRGHIPPVSHVNMLAASGLRKRVTMFPLITTDEADEPVLVHMFHETPVDAPGADEPEQPQKPPLTSREIEVLSLLAAGLRPARIAEQLFISVHTVRKHISNASEKLHSQGMMSAVLAAQRRRLI